MRYQLQAITLITRGLLQGLVIALLIGLLMSFTTVVKAGDQERRQAKRIHDRIAGVPPSDSVLTAMENDIVSNDALGAADRAMNNSAFYNVTL